MLENLDTIDWHHLNHAYGEANDVPELIRALASNDEEARQQIKLSSAASFLMIF